jgi:hypothetical protein
MKRLLLAVCSLPLLCALPIQAGDGFGESRVVVRIRSQDGGFGSGGFVQNQLLVRQRTRLNQLNSYGGCYGVPTNTFANLSFQRNGSFYAGDDYGYGQAFAAPPVQRGYEQFDQGYGGGYGGGYGYPGGYGYGGYGGGYEGGYGYPGGYGYGGYGGGYGAGGDYGYGGYGYSSGQSFFAPQSDFFFRRSFAQRVFVSRIDFDFRVRTQQRFFFNGGFGGGFFNNGESFRSRTVIRERSFAPRGAFFSADRSRFIVRQRTFARNCFR